MIGIGKVEAVCRQHLERLGLVSSGGSPAVPSLSQVLTSGNGSGASNVDMASAQQVRWNADGGLAREAAAALRVSDGAVGVGSLGWKFRQTVHTVSASLGSTRSWGLEVVAAPGVTLTLPTLASAGAGHVRFVFLSPGVTSCAVAPDGSEAIYYHHVSLGASTAYTLARAAELLMLVHGGSTWLAFDLGSIQWVPVVELASGSTTVAIAASGTTHVNTAGGGTATATLADAAGKPGVTYTFARTSSSTLQIDPASDAHFIGLTVGATADGKYLSLDSIGTTVRLTSLASGDWLAEIVGVVTVEP